MTAKLYKNFLERFIAAAALARSIDRQKIAAPRCRPRFRAFYALTIFTLFSLPMLSAATYYVSPSGSDSANDGLSPSTPWQTVAKVNSLTLPPGTTVYFQGGQTFTNAGLALVAGDGGNAANRVVIGSYGTGRATIKPPATVNGCDIYNTAGITIENLIFEGSGIATSVKAGLQAYCDLTGNARLSGLTVTNCEFRQFRKGMEIGAYPADNTFSGFSNVLIDTCVVHDCRRDGIVSYGMYPGSAANQSHANLTIQDCEVYGVTGDSTKTNGHSGSGIILSGVKNGLIERCYAHHNGGSAGNTSGGGPVGIWTWCSDSVTIQHCLVHDQKTSAGVYDGSGFDIDGGASNAIIQYCYSYNNDGPGYLIAQFTGAPPLTNATFRYNISWKDGRRREKNMASGFHFFSDASTATDCSNIRIYNNTVYTDAAVGGPVVTYQSGAMTGIAFRNNVFIVTGGARFTSIASNTAAFTFTGNSWFATDGNYAGGWFWNAATTTSLSAWRATSGTPEMISGSPVGLQGDSRLVSPVSGAQPTSIAALASITAFKIQATSPLLNAGLNLTTAPYGSLNVGTTDFFGTLLPQGNAYDIGAHEAVLTAFQTWLSSYGLPVDGSGNGTDAADSDGDGINNLLEYALGGNPVSANTNILPTASIASDRLQISFVRSRSDVTYLVEASPDLSTWSNVIYSPVAVNQTQTVSDTVDITGATPPRRFLRLKVTRP